MYGSQTPAGLMIDRTSVKTCTEPQFVAEAPTEVYQLSAAVCHAVTAAVVAPVLTGEEKSRQRAVWMSSHWLWFEDVICQLSQAALR